MIYQPIAQYYDYIFPLSPLQVKFIHSYLLNAHRHSLLEVGCGTGNLTNALVGSFGQIVGIDLDKTMIEKMETTPELVVLGSSRTLSLTAENFPNKTFFNTLVTNGSINDFYAFVELFDRKKSFPKEIIICLDQWLLSSKFTDDRWLALNRELFKMEKKTGNNQFNPIKLCWQKTKKDITQLFSLKYLIWSIENYGNNDRFSISDTLLADKTYFLSDGSRKMPQLVENTSVETANKKAESYFYKSKDKNFNFKLIGSNSPEPNLSGKDFYDSIYLKKVSANRFMQQLMKEDLQN